MYHQFPLKNKTGVQERETHRLVNRTSGYQGVDQKRLLGLRSVQACTFEDEDLEI